MRSIAIAIAAFAGAGCSTDLPRRVQDLGSADTSTPPDALEGPVDASALDVAPDPPGAEAAGEPPAQDAGPDAGEPPVDGPSDSQVPDGVTCPNGTCEMAMGEDDFNCPLDCGCAAVGSCGTTAPFGCDCDVCSVILSTNCLDAESACGVPPDPCGNGVCDYCETAATCAVDGCL